MLKQRYNEGMIAVLLIILFPVIIAAEDFKMTAEYSETAVIGQLARIEFEIENTSTEHLVILEIVPSQPCEDPISLIRSLYGSIQYDKDNDQYIYDPINQSQTLIPVSEGVISAGEKLTLSKQYRPFSQSEYFEIRYARVSNEPVYRKSSENQEQWTFTKTGTDSKIAILPSLSQMKKEVLKVEVKMDEVEGTESGKCYCELLQRAVDQPPFSLYKDWDAGKTVEFRVGDNQEGLGPERESAGWKFLNRYEVIYGDGMYMHGEYIRISPEQAPEFWKQIDGKYSIKRIQYFLDDYFYDLESLL